MECQCRNSLSTSANNRLRCLPSLVRLWVKLLPRSWSSQKNRGLKRFPQRLQGCQEKEWTMMNRMKSCLKMSPLMKDQRLKERVEVRHPQCRMTAAVEVRLKVKILQLNSIKVITYQTLGQTTNQSSCISNSQSLRRKAAQCDCRTSPGRIVESWSSSVKSRAILRERSPISKNSLSEAGLRND